MIVRPTKRKADDGSTPAATEKKVRLARSDV